MLHTCAKEIGPLGLPLQSQAAFSTGGLLTQVAGGLACCLLPTPHALFSEYMVRTCKLPGMCTFSEGVALVQGTLCSLPSKRVHTDCLSFPVSSIRAVGTLDIPSGRPCASSAAFITMRGKCLSLSSQGRARKSCCFSFSSLAGEEKGTGGSLQNISFGQVRGVVCCTWETEEG